MAQRATLYLIDGSSYIYRAYFAIRHLSSPSGFPTNALYGFTQMLLKVLKERQPDHVAVVFDAGRATFRHDMYPQYKANRVAMPDDLVPQLAPIKEMVRAFRIPALELAELRGRRHHRHACCGVRGEGSGCGGGYGRQGPDADRHRKCPPARHHERQGERAQGGGGAVRGRAGPGGGRSGAGRRYVRQHSGRSRDR